MVESTERNSWNRFSICPLDTFQITFAFLIVIAVTFSDITRSSLGTSGISSIISFDKTIRILSFNSTKLIMWVVTCILIISNSHTFETHTWNTFTFISLFTFQVTFAIRICIAISSSNVAFCTTCATIGKNMFSSSHIVSTNIILFDSAYIISRIITNILGFRKPHTDKTNARNFLASCSFVAFQSTPAIIICLAASFSKTTW